MTVEAGRDLRMTFDKVSRLLLLLLLFGCLLLNLRSFFTTALSKDSFFFLHLLELASLARKERKTIWQI